MVRRASAPEKAGRWSCSRARSAATSSLRRSARVDSAWPSLMKDGPISCNAAASRSPGRRESRRRANSRAQATSAGAMPSVSSGNSASCRARLSATRSRRQLLRDARAACLRSASPNAGHDTQRHVAPGDAVEARLAHARGQLALRREAADAFMQIAVGLGIAGDDAAEERQGPFGVGVVDAADRRRGHLAEFQAVEAAARLQHAVRFARAPCRCR